VALAEFDDEEKNAKAARKPERRAALVRSTVDAFHADRAAQIAALNAEAEAIRGELARHAAARPGANTSRSVDELLREFAEAFKHQQLATLYAEYRTAVLEPGLSPAQRRLLFDGAVADLKLPGAIRDQQVAADEVLARP
jgi:capsule polysaccharide export protein KpsE/RkpR